nr:hypothetical protein [Cellulomonas sp. PS-H5]
MVKKTPTLARWMSTEPDRFAGCHCLRRFAEPLGLEVDQVRAKRVTVDDAVDAAVAGARGAQFGAIRAANDSGEKPTKGALEELPVPIAEPLEQVGGGC